MNTSHPFTRSQLGDLAAGARALAHIASEDAKRTGNPQIRASVERTERAYRELAAKCERVAREPDASPVALGLPVFRMPPSPDD
jgi:hypothetical protein